MSKSAGLGTVVTLMTQVLSAVFGSETWKTWIAILKAAFALDLTPDERAAVETLTERQLLPTTPVRELWLLLGRRAGKSIIAALLTVWSTCCRSYTLAPGEVGIYMVVAADRRQARVIKRYVSGLLRAHPALEVLVERETAEAIWLTNGLCIEIHTCSFRSLRGYTCVGAAVDEVAFWADEDSANPDHEVLVALRAAMASVPEAMLVGLTSTYARRGEVWRVYEKYFGHDDAKDILVVNGPTQAFNPTISQQVIDAAYEDDPTAAASEYGAAFRQDVESYLTREAVAAVTIGDRQELPHRGCYQYAGFVDPAGGSGRDSMTLAIGHREQDLAVLDVVREVRPPFSPQIAVGQFADLLSYYRVEKVTGDRYAGSWPAEQFRNCGIGYAASHRTKNDIYREFLPLVTGQRIELLDQPRLTRQLLSLERRTSRGGKDVVDHPPKRTDDVANVAAGVLVATLTTRRRQAYLVKTEW